MATIEPVAHKGNIYSQEFSMDKRPSWKTYGSGRGVLRVTTHEKAEWLELYAAEIGEKSAREVYLTLTREQALALRDLLVERFHAL